MQQEQCHSWKTIHRRSLRDAVIMHMPAQMRQLFATLILFQTLSDIHALFTEFQEDMAEDYVRCDQLQDPNATFQQQHIHMCLADIQKNLHNHAKSLQDFPEMPQLPADYAQPQQLADEINIEQEREQGQQMLEQLHPEQLQIHNAIVRAIETQSTDNCFFLDGPAGTGKTFLYNTLVYNLQASGHKVKCVAYSGIAATLLIDGRTAHSTFQIPIPLFDNSTCNIKAQSLRAQQLRNTMLFIWDEASMIPATALKAVDRLLRDITKVNRPFGGKYFMLGGDFRQVPPVVKKAGKERVVQECLKSPKVEDLWSHFQQFGLITNMRAVQDETYQAFSDWLLRVGNGVEPHNDQHQINLPQQTCIKSHEDLMNSIYPQPESVDANLLLDPNTMSERCCLTPKNKFSHHINKLILQRLPTPRKQYLSVDTVQTDDPEEARSISHGVSQCTDSWWNASSLTTIEDNTNLFHFGNNEAGRNPSLNEKIKHIFELALRLNIPLHLHFVPSAEQLADELYDSLPILTVVFETLFGLSSIARLALTFDLIAIAGSVRIDKNGFRLPFYSPFPCEEACTTDVFAQELTPFERLPITNRLKKHMQNLSIFEGEPAHGLRSGCLITLALLGVPTSKIAVFIDWKSDGDTYLTHRLEYIQVSNFKYIATKQGLHDELVTVTNMCKAQQRGPANAFVSQTIKLKPELTGIKFYGTDGEVNVSETCFILVSPGTDNTNLFHFGNNEAGRNPSLNEKIKHIFELALRLNIPLHLHFVPSAEQLADELYDSLPILTVVFETLFGLSSIARLALTFDLIAIAGSVRIDKNGFRLPFYSPFPCEEACTTDVFAQELTPFERLPITNRLKKHMQNLSIFEGEPAHGLRSGCLITLALLGVPTSKIAVFIDWKSDGIVSHYTQSDRILAVHDPGSRLAAEVSLGASSIGSDFRTLNSIAGSTPTITP
eukprot:gene14688-biopygen11788